MKKILLIASVVSLMSQVAFASFATLAPCKGSHRKYFNDSVQEVQKQGYAVKLMKNKADQLVGFFAFGKGHEEAQAYVCDFDAPEDLTVAKQWYYWDYEQGSQDPAKWRKGKTYSIYQDEGFLHMRVLNASTAGNPTLEVIIESTDEGALPAVRDTVTLADE